MSLKIHLNDFKAIVLRRYLRVYHCPLLKAHLINRILFFDSILNNRFNLHPYVLQFRRLRHFVIEEIASAVIL